MPPPTPLDIGNAPYKRKCTTSPPKTVRCPCSLLPFSHIWGILEAVEKKKKKVGDDMGMETMEKRVYPCKDATYEEISDTIGWAVYGFLTDFEILWNMICPVSGAEIPWDTATHIGILGSGNPRCNDALEEAGMKPGVYTNRWGTWLILIHPEEADIQNAVDRCAGRLVSLEAFNTSIPELDVSACPQLEILRVRDDTRLLRVPGLERLGRLTELRLSGCNSLKELPNLERLKRLSELILTRCIGLRELPGLEELEELWSLDLAGCSGLTELRGLEHLQQLTELDLSRCSGLRELPEGIRGLKSLRRLNLSYMKLKTLPDWLPEIAEGFEIKSFSSQGKEKANVWLYKTTVEDMKDLSIFEQPYEVVAEWFKNRALGRTRPLNEIKVVFLGDGEAGKSLTIARLMGDGGAPVDYMDETTPGIVIKDKEYDLDGRKIQVHYWDFGGQEIMHSMHRIFLTNRTMYVVLLNAREDKQGEQAQYWLQNIQSFAPDAPVLLVLNKIDRNPKAELAERTLRAKYPGLTQIVRLSATEFDQDRFNTEFTDVLLEEIVKTGYLEAQWPSSWIMVKERLEKMESHYILGTDYKEICSECQVDDVQTELLHWFNDLGVSFCFCDREDYALKRHVILRPDWITNGLYIILFNECAGARNGQLPHESIYALLERAGEDKTISCTLPEARYDRPGDIEYVLGVMRKFQLSLDTRDGKEFIPMLCQQDSTVDIHYYQNDTDILEFNMEFEYLPENLIHRLMVERHAELDMASAWRKGARFELRDLGYSAVVLIDANTLRFFIRHANSLHRPNTYLTMLKSNVDRIVEKMGLKAPVCKLVYKLDGKRDEFDYEEVKLNWELGDTTMTSRAHRKKVLIEDILNQSAPDGLKDEMQLLDAIRRSCNHLQDERCYRLDPNASNRDKEDLRNRRVRDDLETLGYRVSDQTQRGGGELDLRILDDSRKPWTIIEALRVTDGTKGDWNSHLDKLLAKYNTRGLPVLYLLTYVDADPTAFGNIWRGYQDHIRKYDPEKHIYCEKSFTDLNDDSSPLYIKTAKCQYTSGDKPVTVYHIFARIPTRDE